MSSFPAFHAPHDPRSHPATEPSNEPSNQPFTVRERVRHSFDVFADQILSLREIAVSREGRTGQRVRLGDLVQQALDHFIAGDPAGAQQHLPPRPDAKSPKDAR